MTTINFDKVTRLEVIDESGRKYTRWDCSVEPAIQDGGRTLKLFIGPSEPQVKPE